MREGCVVGEGVNKWSLGIRFHYSKGVEQRTSRFTSNSSRHKGGSGIVNVSVVRYKL